MTSPAIRAGLLAIVATVLAAIFLPAHAASPGSIEMTQALCTKSGIDAVVKAAKVSQEATTTAIVEQQAKNACAVTDMPVPVMMIKRVSTYRDFENDSMEVWLVVGPDGRPTKTKFYVWAQQEPAI